MNILERLLFLVVLGFFIAFTPACYQFEEQVDQRITQEAIKALDPKYELGLISLSPGEPRLEVTASFTMPQDEVFIRLPDKFLRKEKLYDRIENLRVVGDGQIEPY